MSVWYAEKKWSETENEEGIIGRIQNCELFRVEGAMGYLLAKRASREDRMGFGEGEDI
jgi:hypothetical protein